MNIIDKLIQMDKEFPRRILIIGDPMTDVYIHGRLEDCQEGCPKFVEESRVMVPGGAKNAARSLENWKSYVHCSVWDQAGCIKTRMMVDNKCIFRYDNDNWLHSIDIDRIRKGCLEAFKWKPHAVLLSDYDKGLLTPEMINDIARICAENNIPCVADVKREPGVYKGCILKGNFLYSTRYAYQLDVVTYGRNNPYVNGIIYGPDKLYVKCINHVGAGDCFAAHMTLVLAYGFSLKDAAAIGHSAGRVYVQHLHNQPPTLSKIRKDMLSEI